MNIHDVHDKKMKKNPSQVQQKTNTRKKQKKNDLFTNILKP
jgi:hypothetical protein